MIGGFQLVFFAILADFCYGICPLESLYDVQSYPILWKDNGEKYIIPQMHTICLTEERKLLVRQCIENQWFPLKRDVPKFYTKIPELSYEKGVFILYSEYDADFGKDGIFFTKEFISMIGGTRYSNWYPFTRDHPDLLFYPLVSFLPGDDFGKIYDQDEKENCLVIDDKGDKIYGVNCSSTHQKTMMPINLLENELCPENSFSFSFEEGVCIGLDLKDSEPVTIEEFAEKGYTIYESDWNDLRARILDSTTVEGADIVMDFQENIWKVIDGDELNEYPILTKKRVMKENVKIVFNPLTHEITCEACHLLWKQQSFSYPFKCFTNANDQYIENIKITKTSLNIYSLQLHSKPGLSFYWCAGHSIFGLEQISTERYILGTDGEELVVHIAESFSEGDDLNSVANRLRRALGLPIESLNINNIVPPDTSVSTPDYNEISWNLAILYLRPFEIRKSNKSENSAEVLCHIIIDPTFHISLNQFGQYFKEIFGSNYLGSIRSTKFCYQELLEPTNPTVFWKTVAINQYSTLNSPKYVTQLNLRPMRKCIGDFLRGAVLEPFDITTLVLLSTTESLDEMLKSTEDKSVKHTIEDLDFVVTNDKNNLTSLDFKYIGNILETVDTANVSSGEETHVLSNMTSICSSLLDSPPCVNCDNSTNVISFQIEDIIDDLLVRPDVETSDQGVHFTFQDYFLVYSIDVSVANVSGLAFYSIKDPNRFSLKYLYKNTSMEKLTEIVKGNLEMATFFPENILNYWKFGNDSRIVLKIYGNDNLFQEKCSSPKRKVEFNITSMSVPNYPVHDFGGHVVPIIFRFEGQNPECHYWNYKTSSWSNDGVSSYEMNSYRNLIFCNLTHLTSFTHLVDLIKGPNGKAIYDFWLDIITLTSSVLSLLGVLGIFMTMVLLKKWRKTKSTKILLQLNIASFIQILAFLIVSFYDFDDEYSLLTCATFGALLQYTVLVQFLWMMIIAKSNWRFYKYPFQRDQQPEYEKFTLVSFLAWGFPLIPVVAVIGYGLNVSFKTSNFDYDICSPTADTKLWGFVVPIYSVLAINLFFYILLIIEFIKLCNSPVPKTTRRKILVPILRNLSILFFTLGFPWIFGLLHVFCAEMRYPNVFSYIFVMTAPLQGFIMFLYFVVFNPSVKEEWSACVLAAKRKTREDQKLTDRIISFIAKKISDFWYIIYFCVLVFLNFLEQIKS